MAVSAIYTYMYMFDKLMESGCECQVYVTAGKRNDDVGS